MEPITVIVTALATAAAAASKKITTEAAKDAYSGLKALIIRKFAEKEEITTAVEQLEEKPNSVARRDLLKEKLAAADADQDQELLNKAHALLDLLKKHGHNTDNFSVHLIGDGAVAQGDGAVAAGKGGIAVRGDINGCVHINNTKIPVDE